MTDEEKKYMKAVLEESCAYNGLRILEELDKENNELKLKLNKQKEINKEYVDETEQLKKEYKQTEKEYAELKIKYAELKKNALEWHKVTCFDEPDENGYITNDCPGYDNREYFVRTKSGHYVIQELREIDNGIVFEDCEWEEIEAWAEIPEGM